jgi:phenylalanyl-tRNA synthetase beta chain
MTVAVELVAVDLCPRYSARVVTGLRVGPSPAWLTERLEACGVRALNNVVDITNFVNLELNQPLHAFDLVKLRGRKLVIRRAAPGEPLTLLTDRALELSAEDLVIADAEGPVALAGVMGGATAEVTAGTEAVVIESAYFEPRGIRRTSRRYGVATESSYRFERGVDPAQTLAAADRAAALLAEVAGGTVLGPPADRGRTDWAPGDLVLRPRRANLLIGTDLSDEEAADLLRRLGFGVTLDRRENLLVTVPTWRRDITAEVDLVEEVARAYGYENVTPTLPGGRVPEPVPNGREEFERRARRVLTACGFDEAYTPSFTHPAALLAVGYGDEALVPVANPTTAQFSHLRPALWPMLADVARRNGLLGVPGVRLFEVGTAFTPGPGGAPQEHYRLAALAAGEVERRHWSDGAAGRRPRRADAFTLLGVLEEFARAFNVPLTVTAGPRVTVGPATGALSTLALEPFGEAFALELDVAAWAAGTRVAPRRYEAVPRFPFVARDLALVIRDDVPAGDVVAAVRASDPRARDVTVFDRYAGPGIPPGHQGLGIRIRYQADDRTLTDEDANDARGKALRLLQERFGAVLRA